MQYYRLIRPTGSGIWDYFITKYNVFMRRLAYRSAENQVRATGKSYYGAEMFGSIVVMSSVEKDDINRKMPKGNAMNHAEFLRHKVFHVTPEMVRKKIT